MKRETVSNKHNFVNYHIACKEIAVVVLYVAKEDTKTYLAEVSVKLLAYSRNLALLGGLFVGLRDYRFFCFIFNVRTNPCVYELARRDRLS